MKLCRFQPLVFDAMRVGRTLETTRPEPRFGVVAGDSVREIPGDPFGRWNRTGATWPLEDVRLLPPIRPGKIVCVGRNYAEHARELGNEVPAQPLIFLKPPSAVIGPEEPIVLPRASSRVDYEGELAVVIGQRCSQLGPNDDVEPFVLGFTCLNDVTARDIQKAEGHFTRAKGFDTFCPLGPVIETELDLSTVRVETFVNGERKQSARLSEMIVSVDAIIRSIAAIMSLEPGDVIATGTPPGVGPLSAGNVVEVAVEGIGTLRNPVVSS